MPTVADVLAVKGEQVHSVSPQTTVLDTIRKMNQHKIGAVLVTRNTSDMERIARIFAFDHVEPYPQPPG